MFKKIILFSILLTALITGSVKAVTYYFPEQGGTGTNTKPVDSQILIGAPDGLYDVKTLTAGTNIIITSTTNALTITSSGGGGSNTWDWIVNGDIMYATSVATFVGLGGAGATTPQSTLEISSVEYTPSFSIKNTDTAISAGETFGTINWISSDTSTGGAGTTTQIYSAAKSGFSGNGRDGEIIFKTATYGVVPAVLSERLRVGTETTITGDLIVTGSGLVVDAEGYVGIGTSTPSSAYLLSVGATSGKQVLIDNLGYIAGNLLGRASTTNQISTLTNTKWCSTDGSVITCTEDAPAGSGDITSVGTCLDGACDNFTLNELTITYGLTAATSTLSATSTALGLVLTGTATSTIAGSLDINGSLNVAGGITAGLFVGPLTGTASLATALAANGANCTNQFPLGVNASGAVENCTTITTAYMDLNTITLADFTNDANFWTTTSASSYFNATNTLDINIVGNVTGNLTGTASLATALAANPTNCSAGQYPLGIDASGNVEDCTVAGAGGGSNTWDWIVSGTTMYSTSTAKTIGVSTTTPRYTLDIWGDLIIGTTTAGATSNYPTLYVKSGNGWGVSLGTTTNTNLFKIGTTTDYLIVDRQGQVGIGTTTPTSLFSVEGEVYISATSTSRGLIVDDGVNATATPQFGDANNPSCLKMYDGFRGEWVYLRPSNSQTSGFVTTTASVCNTN